MRKQILSKAWAAALAATLTLGTATAQPGFPYGNNTYSDIIAWMDQLAIMSSPSVEAFTFSAGTSHQGRNIKALTVRPALGLPVIVCIAANNPREWPGVVLVQDLMNEIVTGTDSDFDVLRNSYEMVFIPVMNPDGYEWTWTDDRLWPKNRNSAYHQFCWGVNLDRNWPVCFGGADSSNSPCNDKYHGPVSLSEPETQALRNLLASIPNLAAVVDFRADPYLGGSNAGAVLYPYGDLCGCPASCLPTIAASMSSTMPPTTSIPTTKSYFQGPLSASPYGPASGVMIDWCHSTLNTPAFQFYPENPGHDQASNAQMCQANRQLLPGLAAALPNECSPTCGRMAGDFDNFAIAGQPADALFQRPAFAAWLSRPGGINALLHNGQPLPFDTVTTDWWFGYTFCVPATATSGRLTLRVRGSNSCENDAFYLRFDGMTVTWGDFIRNLELLAGGDGAWNPGETMTLTLDLAALPVSGGGTVNLMPQIAADGFLDVYMQDDTGVDFLELSLCEYPAVGGSCLGAPCPTCPGMLLATTGTPLSCSTQFGPQSRFTIQLTGAPSGGAALFLLNVGPCTTGLPWACGAILPNPIGWLAIPSAPLGGSGACGGSARLPLVVPCGTQGITLCAQAAIACPTGGLGLTNGIEFTIE